MLRIDERIKAADLLPAITAMWAASATKITLLAHDWPADAGSPVVTVDGRYTGRGWTEWTQGFQHGSALLQFDATDDASFLELGRDQTYRHMARHVTHMGVHDHGFNIGSTYGNLWRLHREGRIEMAPGELRYVELALAASGAVQARRWTRLADGGGFIHSFNGRHSLFVDTIRSLRSLAVAYQLGHVLLSEQDAEISLLGRLVDHARATDCYSVFHGRGRDSYDEPGRVAHECIFDTETGRYICPSSQQGYSPFSTWTRGLAWAMLGFAEQHEYVVSLPADDLADYGGPDELAEMMLGAARETCDFYIRNSPTDGVPYWDTGAPGLARLGDHLEREADPFNGHEPVDSSAGAIAAQALLRLGHILGEREPAAGEHYWRAGLTLTRSLLGEPYLSDDQRHHGLLLHSIYHRPNGWDHIPEGSAIPYGEAAMWGDYHMRELALYVGRAASAGPYLAFHAPDQRFEPPGDDVAPTSLVG